MVPAEGVGPRKSTASLHSMIGIRDLAYEMQMQEVPGEVEGTKRLGRGKNSYAIIMGREFGRRALIRLSNSNRLRVYLSIRIATTESSTEHVFDRPVYEFEICFANFPNGSDTEFSS